jgi:hypothetical protein
MFSAKEAGLPCLADGRGLSGDNSEVTHASDNDRNQATHPAQIAPRGRVLIVDDDPGELRYFSLAL